MDEPAAANLADFAKLTDTAKVVGRDGPIVMTRERAQRLFSFIAQCAAEDASAAIARNEGRASWQPPTPGLERAESAPVSLAAAAAAMSAKAKLQGKTLHSAKALAMALAPDGSVMISRDQLQSAMRAWKNRRAKAQRVEVEMKLGRRVLAALLDRPNSEFELVKHASSRIVADEL